MNNNLLAPLWRRGSAWITDVVILVSVGLFIDWSIRNAHLSEKSRQFFMLVYTLLTPFYFYQWKKWRSTPGKRLFQLVVADHNLRTTVSGDRAPGRSLLVVPILIFMIYFLIFPDEKQWLFVKPWKIKIFTIWGIWFIADGLWGLLDRRRQFLHDKLFRTVVLYRPAVSGRVFESQQETKSFSYLILTIFTIFSVYPILRVFSISIRPGDRLLSKSLAIIPENATLQTYYELFANQPFLRWLLNSFIVSAAVTVLGVALAATAGYAFSRYKFRGRDSAMLALITTQMFPATMLLLPLFIMLIKIGAYDSYLGLIIAYSATALPFTTWQMKGYYDTIPYSLEEAASIDGCSPIGIFWRIILPLATPALAITALFSFMTAWSEYLVAAVLIQDKNLFTLPLGLKLFQSAMQTSWGLYSAGAVVVSIPVVMIFLLLSRWLVSGLTLGSVKG